MATINAATEAELISALSNAVGGDTIVLTTPNGNYGSYLNFTGLSYASEVIVKSLDSNNPAVIYNGIVSGVNNMTYQNITFRYLYNSSDAVTKNTFKFNLCNNLKFTNCNFEGDYATGRGTLEDGKGWGKGPHFDEGSNITVEYCKVWKFWKGITFGQISNQRMTNTEIFDIRADGINLSRIDGGLIERCYIHDFRIASGFGDHVDMIQVLRGVNNAACCYDVTIKDNIFDQGEGHYAQVIFIGTPQDPNIETNWHKRFTITGNVIYNSHTNGIAIAQSRDTEISNNMVLRVRRHVDQYPGTSDNPNIGIDDNDTGVIMKNNICRTDLNTKYGSNVGWDVSGNVQVTPDEANDTTAPYGNLFTYDHIVPTDTYNRWEVVAGQALDIPTLGPNFLRASATDYYDWIGQNIPLPTLPVMGSSILINLTLDNS